MERRMGFDRRRAGRGTRSSGTVIRRALAFFIPAFVALTFVAGIVYGVAQQANRIGANDPQIQLAEAASRRLDAGEAASSVIGLATLGQAAGAAGAAGSVGSAGSAVKVDVATDLDPFIVVFDSSGAVLASGGTLDGHDPIPPKGVLASAGGQEWNAVTWQPRDGVRIAVVAVAWKGGTVLAGRSLRVVEDRIASLGLLVSLAWGVSLVALAIAALVAAGLWPESAGSSARGTRSS
jgi:hypothetical protein